MTVMAAMTSGKVHLCPAVAQQGAFVQNAKDASEQVTVANESINLWTVLKESILWNMKAFIERN
jgi:hypothetical protein